MIISLLLSHFLTFERFNVCIEFIATTVGGGYINGTAESIATSGLVY
jgi:hypothetical protein